MFSGVGLAFFVIVGGGILSSGCAPGLPQEVRALIPLYRGEALTVRTQRKLVDDFAGPAGQNDVGGRWAVLGPGSLAYMKDDALRLAGSSLALRFAAGRGGEGAVFETGLNGLDVSQARALSLYVKGGSGLREALEVSLEDAAGHRAEAPVAPFYIGKRGKWREALIPRSTFRDVDFDHLRVMRIQGLEGAAGEVLVDEVAFRGDPDLFFASLRDNLYGFRDKTRKPAATFAGLYDDALLREVARDTWLYFVDLVDRRNEFPVDHLKLEPPAKIGDYASPTNIGLYYAAVAGALELGFIERPWAVERLTRSIDSLEKLPRWHGFFHNYYSTSNRQVTRRFISTVDNGWLAAGLIVVRQTFPELSGRASRLLAEMNFRELYDEEKGLLRLGLDVDEAGAAEPSEHHYGQLVSEARIASVIGIGKGDLPRDHWFRLHRTLPAEWTWQTQLPKGVEKVYEGRKVFQGYYEVGGEKIVPSWGGSLFEFLMPTLFVDEQDLALKSLAANNARAVWLHRRYALGERGYPVWGLSPASYLTGSESGYGEFGVKALGAKGYPDKGVVAPHVSFLALAVDKQLALENVRAFLARFDCYGPYGLYDSVTVSPPRVHRMVLALDQGMTFLALANAIKDNVIVRRFHADPVGRAFEPVLSVESFFE